MRFVSHKAKTNCKLLMARFALLFWKSFFSFFFCSNTVTLPAPSACVPKGKTYYICIKCEILGAAKSTARRSTGDEASDDSRGVEAIPVTSQPNRQMELLPQSPACSPDGRAALPAPPGSCLKLSSAPSSCSSDLPLGRWHCSLGISEAKEQ